MSPGQATLDPVSSLSGAQGLTHTPEGLACLLASHFFQSLTSCPQDNVWSKQTLLPYFTSQCLSLLRCKELVPPSSLPCTQWCRCPHRRSRVSGWWEPEPRGRVCTRCALNLEVCRHHFSRDRLRGSILGSGAFKS